MANIGTAGWTIPASYKERFPHDGTHLHRYAQRLDAVEINSTFYRPYKRSTYERWADSVPDGFRFSVKAPREIINRIRTHDYGALSRRFLHDVSGLGVKLSVLLAQLPPSLGYDAETIPAFLQDLGQAGVIVACEPRHASWFTPEVDETLNKLGIPRVAADPPRAPGDGVPGGDTRVAYYRLHGSPKIYYSDYSQGTLKALAPRLRNSDWCIFDNTAQFHAWGNALYLKDLVTCPR